MVQWLRLLTLISANGVQFSVKLAVFSYMSLSLCFMCSDQHVKERMPRGFPLTSSLLLDYHDKQYTHTYPMLGHGQPCPSRQHHYPSKPRPSQHSPGSSSRRGRPHGGHDSETPTAPSDESENFFQVGPLLTIVSTLFHGFSNKSRFCAIFFTCNPLPVITRAKFFAAQSHRHRG